jgi:hypothetical protein
VTASVFSGPVREGEISLIALLQGRPLAVLSFSIVQGRDVQLDAATTLLISRVQGYRSVGADVDSVTSALDVAPPLLLMAALVGAFKLACRYTSSWF